ncbi:MAG: 1-acyl-sn-glycerol-3-phosphate acyltransferase [Lentisphaerae bacterium]|nr:1-acyl-sn-glycerol-3-phosphate acyltransferase [Lentisphaerota bacterium]
MSEYMFKGLDSYDTPAGHPVATWFKLLFRSRWYFYYRNFRTFIRTGKCGSKGELDGEMQIHFSNDNIRLVEDCGGTVHLRGLNNLRDLNGEPVVIIGNHMSLLETAALHAIIREYVDFSFVVKESLYDIPYMRDILKALGAIPVTRANPREDLKKVLTDGKKVLESGRSMVVFPQSTRTRFFDEEQFNSIGIKLAKSAGVRVVPMALKTDFLECGKLIRDLGPIYPQRPVRFEFGAPLTITGNGQEQQKQVVEFIKAAFVRWEESEKQVLS